MSVALRLEKKRKAARTWPAWERREFAPGLLASMVGHNEGWHVQATHGYGNGIFAIMVRPAPGGVLHLAIRTLAGSEPSWAELQRIKDELIGPERFAVQVYPPRSLLVDAAEMYHLWVMPEGYVSPFGIGGEEGGG